MSNIIFFDDNEVRRNLLPLTYTRPTAMLRCGITTIASKWKAAIGDEKMTYSFLTTPYLKKKFPLIARRANLMIAGHVLPNDTLVQQVLALKSGEALMLGEELIAFRGAARDFDNRHFTHVTHPTTKPIMLHYPYDIFEQNAAAMALDFERLTAGRKSQPISKSCTVIGDKERIFIEPGAKVEGAFLNTTEGHIYIGADAEVMEGCCIRAPFAACRHAVAKMGCKIYGATTFGPYCKVGGEVANVVMQGYSNKAHDGFLGNAVIGEWCNIGGGTTASNLKNDYSEVKLWNYASKRFLRTGRQFCGLIMGDHCKTGVNCMINTGTVMGVGVNLHGAGFPRPFVGSFLEGSDMAGFKNVKLDAFFATAERVMSRRGITLTDADRTIYEAIYNIRDKYK